MNETRRPLQVYVVEDSPIVQQFLATAIADAGAEMDGCSDDATTAIADVFALQPDVILIDIQLARGNGLDVLRVLQEHCLVPEALKVVLSSHASAEYENLSLLLGADRFFDKSWETPDAMALIKDLAAQKQTTSAPLHH
jgi:DNA-binding NarL/FixJ family response regulator